jgi:hypothetical protein
VISVAEAAAGGPTPEERREIARKYAEARACADRRFYTGWAKRIAALHDGTVEPRGWRHVSDALWFEHTYVLFYEEGFDCALKESADASWSRDLPHRKHFDAHVARVLDDAARFRKSLEANIDFATQKASGDGAWAVHQLYREADSVLDMDFYTVLQKDPDCKNSFLHLGQPGFEEAVLAGRFHVAVVSPGHEQNMRAGWLVFFKDGTRSDHVIAQHQGSLEFSKDTWFWLVAHFKRTGRGEWKMESWVWPSGAQPPNPRRLLPGDPGLEGRGDMSFTAKGPRNRGPGGIAFSAAHAKIEWQAVTLRILRPAPGKGGKTP